MFPIVVVALVLAFQIFVTWRLWRDEAFIASEKRAQTQLIWLLPLLGAVFVFAMLWDETKHQKQGS